MTKTPCHEFTAFLEMQGMKTVVLSKELEEGEKQVITYTKFPEGVKGGKFICFFLKMDVKRTL